MPKPSSAPPPPERPCTSTRSVSFLLPLPARVLQLLQRPPSLPLPPPLPALMLLLLRWTNPTRANEQATWCYLPPPLLLLLRMLLLLLSSSGAAVVCLGGVELSGVRPQAVGSAAPGEGHLQRAAGSCPAEE
jgi:hypothetical protein